MKGAPSRNFFEGGLQEDLRRETVVADAALANVTFQHVPWSESSSSERKLSSRAQWGPGDAKALIARAW
jgi:hypothetical protein